MAQTNPGPASTATSNTQLPVTLGQFIQTISVSLTPLAVATITTAEQSFGLNGVSQVTAATGIKKGDVILSIAPPSMTAGVGISGYRCDVTTDDKFYIQFVNPTAGSVTPPSGQYLITVARYNASNFGPGTLAGFPATIQ